MILIAPDGTIVEQDIWPIGVVNDIINVLETYPIAQAPCVSALTADFSGTPTTLPIGNSVDFTDLSTNGTPTSWNWTFPGGSPPSSTLQNPVNIVYNTAGNYDVTLEVSDGNTTDIETKTMYIEVTPPTTLWADFVASQTTIVEGQTIDFTDLSYNGPPTSWSWDFPGAVFTNSYVQNPIGVQYNVPGVYDVTLEVSDGANTHSATKTSYITVIDSSMLPQIDFTADFTTVFVGGSVNFFDLTTNNPDSWQWYFEDGNPATSTDQNPAVITYNNVGTYDVTLVATNLVGSDSVTKTDYITVIDNSFLDSLYADFKATGSRLIVQGGTVSFQDLTVGYPTNWEWTFFGGAPLNSNTQHPMNITYNTPGLYDVQLVVSNGLFNDTIIKKDFIVVTSQPWQDPNGFCDTTRNIIPGEMPLSFRHLQDVWGYFPGHNGYNIRSYADIYTNYTISNVQGVLVPVVKAYSASSSGKVRFQVWDVDSLTGMPGTELAYKDIPISSFTPYIYHSVLFDNPVDVDGTFYVGFTLYYSSAQDTFVTYMAPDRGLNGTNTLVVKKGTWKYPYDVLPDTLNTSIAIELIGCLVEVEEIDFSEFVNIYPNPANNHINIEISDGLYHNAIIKVYDIYGRMIDDIQVNSDRTLIDTGNYMQGIYLVNIQIEDQLVTKKITIIK